MSGPALNRRLLAPRWSGSFADLAEGWTSAVVEVDLQGMGAFAGVPNLLNKVRGAWGDALLAGASEAVRNGHPCTWSPPCAAEAFFGRKPAIRIGAADSEITKPYVLSAERKGQHLLVRLRIFGFADLWTQPAAHALAEALRARVRWDLLARDDGLFVPKRIEIDDLRVVSDERICLSLPPEACQVCFLTPLDAERGALDERPCLLFERLARRMSMLARWYDLSIETPWHELEEAWRGCHYELPEEGTFAGTRPPARGGHRLRNAMSPHRVVDISGPLETLWPLLRLGELAHVGRGANIGLGRYLIADP